ncbi:MAG: anti-sigma factor [Lysobacterales bacterium]
MDRYLDRELDDGERDWFEAYLLDRPQLIEELEADEAVRAALTSIPNPTADELSGKAPTPTNALRYSLRWLPLAAAASITGAVISAALLYRDAAPVETAYATMLDVSRSNAAASPVVLKSGATNVLSIAFAPEVTAAWWESGSGSRKRPIEIDPAGFGTIVIRNPEELDLQVSVHFELGNKAYERKLTLSTN